MTEAMIDFSKQLSLIKSDRGQPLSSALTQLQFSLLEKLCELRPPEVQSKYVSRRGSSVDSNERNEELARSQSEYTLPQSRQSFMMAAVAATNINPGLLH